MTPNDYARSAWNAIRVEGVCPVYKCYADVYAERAIHLIEERIHAAIEEDRATYRAFALRRLRAKVAKWLRKRGKVK